MKKLIILLFALITFNVVCAQSCLPEGITFLTQAQIDSFQINYPGCRKIEGDVFIGGIDIANLYGLNLILSIGGSLSIGYYPNPNLKNLSGLDNLSSIGGSLTISDNPLLTDINGLSALKSIGSNLFLGTQTWLGWPIGNPSLTSLVGLEGITSLNGLFIIGNSLLKDLTGLNNIQSISGPLFIFSNGSLSSLKELKKLNAIGDLRIIDNPLNNLDGLEGIKNLSGSVTLISNHFTSLSGLQNITTIGYDLDVRENNFLKNFSGLGSLRAIGGDFRIAPCDLGSNEGPIPGANNSLTNLKGLENLTSIGGGICLGGKSLKSLEALTNLKSINNLFNDPYVGITICGADSLTSLTGLDNIEAGTINYLSIWGCSLLSVCDVESICKCLANPNSLIYFGDNARGCNSQQEVEAACASVDVESISDNNECFTITPNPSSGQFTINFCLNNQEHVNLVVLNSNGQVLETLLDELVLPGEDILNWDTKNNPTGIYYCRLIAGNKIISKKMIKIE